jgi:DNA-binding CsgD family transcriptional regulator
LTESAIDSNLATIIERLNSSQVGNSVTFDHRMALMWDIVLGDCTWDVAMQAISSETGHSTTTVFMADGSVAPAESVRFWSHRLDESAFGTRDVLDLLDPTRNPLARNMQRAQPSDMYYRRALISDREFEYDPAFCAVRGQNIYHGWVAPLVTGQSVLAGAWIGLPKNCEEVSERSGAVFHEWLRPIRRAVRTMSLIGDRTRDGAMPEPAEDGLGVVTVTASLRILGANAEGQRILTTRDGIESSRGELAILAADDELRRRLRQLWVIQSESLVTSLRVQRPSGLPPYDVDIVPSRTARATARVLIFDPASEANLPDTATIMVRFGLTPAEARVARLTTLALSKARIAHRLGLSENTVKTHLAAIRDKLGTRSTTGIALMMRRA